MPVNPQLESPTFRDFALDEDLGSRTLRGLDIWAEGDVHIADILDTERTRSFTAPFPVRWVIQIKKVFSSDTTVSVDDLDGLQ